MKRSFQSEGSEAPTLRGVTWLWIDQKGAAKEFTDEESDEIEQAFKSSKSLQLGPWTILNLEGVLDGHLYHLIRRPNTSPYAFTLTPDDVTTPESWKSENPEIPPELTSFSKNLIPYYFFSMSKPSRWCPFADSERNEYAERLYELYRRERVDKEWDYDRECLFSFKEAKLLKPLWCYWDGPSVSWLGYSVKQSRVINEAWRKDLDHAIIDVELEVKGNERKRFPYKVDLKGLRQYPVDNPERYRRIRKVVEERKLLRVMVGWFWLQDKERNIWVPYSKENMRTIEEAFISNQSCVWIIVSVDGSDTKYKINFARMEQHNINKETPEKHLHDSSSKRNIPHAWTRKVRRVGPRMNNRQQIEYPNNTISTTEHPSHWSKETPSEITPTSTSLFCVDPNSEEWAKVARYMQDSFIPDYRRNYGCIPGTQDPPSRFHVIKIQRIQAPTTLWCEYQNNKAEIRKKDFSNGELQDLLRKKPLALGKDSLLDENANELYLFHGTKNNLICHIAEEGFTNRNVLEFIQGEAYKYDGMFGSGMYFAENSSKSNQYVDCPNCMKGAMGCFKAGTKEFDPCKCTPEDVEKKGGYVMILARVLLGDTHICTFRDYQEDLYKSKCVPPGDKDSIWAEPPEPQFNKVNPKYGIGNREFIVFEPEKIYPEYLIYYLRK
eukprot:TRINITY_DN5714_c0_g1_i3.p1 TRINITY_DN5714_c0_g1~~TRINITY_DN5714_c0_g1_i3.p1  ORF type:complete len:664 (-),score=123.60 TRINITY_DN5714_c0_g1_i3:1051-3042(-)